MATVLAGQREAMSDDEPTHHLSADEMRVLKLAVRRQLARWANKRDPNARQQAQRASLQQVLRVLEDPAFAGGCGLRAPTESADV